MKNIDELSKAEIDVLFEESNQELDKLEARWEGLVQQTEQERARSIGRSLGVLGGPLGLLLDILMPKNGKESDLAKHFNGLGDDALHTGAMVVAPGMMAIALPRTLAGSSAAHRSVLAPVLDAFRALTKAARASAAEARAAKKPTTP